MTAPMGKPQPGLALRFPLGESAPTPLASGASLSTEDDFELGGEFLDVFVRAGERVAGFVAGCILVAGIWILWAAL
ncbi:MAG TPA: hypothetical protein VIY09_02025 [Rhizomicrobium sp.]